MNPPRSTSSQIRFAAVNLALSGFERDVVTTLERHRERARTRVPGWDELPDAELAQVARYARGHAEGAVKLAHDKGVGEGRAQVRAELGLPPEGLASPEDDTRRLGPCPVDGRLCPVPAAAPRKDPPR